MDDLNNITIENDLQALSLYILGEPASKANSRRVVRIGNMSRLIKSQKALDYCDRFKQQCKPLANLMTRDVRAVSYTHLTLPTIYSV